jgi:hypothetical protein
MSHATKIVLNALILAFLICELIAHLTPKKSYSETSIFFFLILHLPLKSEF